MVETTSKSRYTKLEPEALKACKDEIETMRKGVHYFCYTELRPPATIIIFSGFLGIIGTKDEKFCISGLPKAPVFRASGWVQCRNLIKKPWALGLYEGSMKVWLKGTIRVLSGFWGI